MNPVWFPTLPPDGTEESITTENLQKLYKRMTNKQIKCGSDGFIQLIDHMGNDQSICNAARVSYGNHEQVESDPKCSLCEGTGYEHYHPTKDYTTPSENPNANVKRPCICTNPLGEFQQKKDSQLIRYLMSHRHTTPFEMVEFIFLVRAPIHVVRQWHRHRMWSYNEYSMRYKPAIDSMETTDPDKWRLQATDNKQGSSGYLEEWPEGTRHGDMISILPDDTEYFSAKDVDNPDLGLQTPGEYLSEEEEQFQELIKTVYEKRIKLGVAKEQARKDLPLSNYTEFYAKTDLHNLFHFLGLRLDSHAQLEIRTFAEAISNIIKPIVPIAYKAFEDYRLNGAHFSAMEMEVLKQILDDSGYVLEVQEYREEAKMTDREWSTFLAKMGQ